MCAQVIRARGRPAAAHSTQTRRVCARPSRRAPGYACATEGGRSDTTVSGPGRPVSPAGWRNREGLAGRRRAARGRPARPARMTIAYEDRWSRHYQDAWEKRSGDLRLPGWLRLAAYAYAKHGANGHAPLVQGSKHGPGTLQLALTTVDPETGAHREPSRQRLHEWIKAAVDLGWLAPGSSTRCLIVPPSDVAGGLGNPKKPCATCTRRSTRHVAA